MFVYSLEKSGLGRSLLGGVSNWLFDAGAVDEEVSPSNARQQLGMGNLGAALDIALRLQMHHIIEEIIEAAPYSLSEFCKPPSYIFLGFILPVFLTVPHSRFLCSLSNRASFDNVG